MRLRRESYLQLVVLVLILVPIVSVALYYVTSKDILANVFKPEQLRPQTRPANFLRCAMIAEPMCDQCRNTSVYRSSNYHLREEETAFFARHFTNYTNFTKLIQSRIQEALLLGNIKPNTVVFANLPSISMPRPLCDGLWLEFGVYTGKSIRLAAKWKSKYCKNDSATVYGFDSFEGLPSDWRPAYGRGAFNLSKNTTIDVPANVKLVPGWFINTLPDFLHTVDQQHQCLMPVTFLHVDCDLYESTRDIFYLLGSRLVRNSIIIFDELMNYPQYERHELRVLFEYMSTHPDFGVRVIGAGGPLLMNVTKDHPHQSVAFVVI